MGLSAKMSLPSGGWFPQVSGASCLPIKVRVLVPFVDTGGDGLRTPSDISRIEEVLRNRGTFAVLATTKLLGSYKPSASEEAVRERVLEMNAVGTARCADVEVLLNQLGQVFESINQDEVMVTIEHAETLTVPFEDGCQQPQLLQFMADVDGIAKGWSLRARVTIVAVRSTSFEAPQYFEFEVVLKDSSQLSHLEAAVLNLQRSFGCQCIIELIPSLTFLLAGASSSAPQAESQ